MLSFLFFSMIFLWNSFFGLIFFLLFIIFFFNNFSWSGLFFIMDSNTFMLLIIMSLFIMGMIFISEKNNNLKILSYLLVMVCSLFFVSSNMLMLYMYFELSMFPIIVMILGYGYQIEKINSSYYLIFYAAFCSFPFLFIYYNTNFMVVFCYYDVNVSWELMFILSLSFMMKFPIYFLHLWLPKAHVEAPTTASMLLAGLLLKLGTAGFFRILYSFNMINNNIWVIISFLGMILGSFCCIFQSDSKSLAAYSSVTHMGFLLLGLALVSMSGKISSLMLMLAHGYTSTLMFYIIGEYYHTSGSRMIYFLNSFFNSSMVVGILFFLIFLSNSGVPPSLSFLSEFMVISNGFLIMKTIFFIIFIYFFVSFYYSLYFITNGLMGKNMLNMNNWNMGFSTPLIFMMFNIFWLSFFYYKIEVNNLY